MAANARLLKSFPKGFALDETHHPHVSMLQQFVRTDDLDKIYAAGLRKVALTRSPLPDEWPLFAQTRRPYPSGVDVRTKQTLRIVLCTPTTPR